MGANIGWCDAETTTYDARSVKVLFTQTETNITRIITLTQTPHATVNPGNQPYFQFGRKDPMLGGILNASGFSIDKDCYSDSYAFDKLGTGKVTIGISIQNPYVFYNYGGVVPQDWCSTSYYNLWSADNTVTTPNDNTVVKTIYDPSPIGYHCLLRMPLQDLLIMGIIQAALFMEVNLIRLILPRTILLRIPDGCFL